MNPTTLLRNLLTDPDRSPVRSRGALMDYRCISRRQALHAAAVSILAASGMPAWGQAPAGRGPTPVGAAPAGAAARRTAPSPEGPVELRDLRVAGDLSRVKLTFSVKGVLKAVKESTEGGNTLPTKGPAAGVSKSGKPTTSNKPTTASSNTAETIDVPMSATSRILYDERILELAGRSARVYRHCDADLSVADQQLKRALRPDHSLIICSVASHKGALNSPAGALSREELDLMEVHGNSLLIYGMLPTDGAKSTGDRWVISPEVLAGLLNLDGADSAEVNAQLAEVSQGLAIVRFSGTVAGYADGVSANVDVKGELRYDLNWGRISWFQWAVRERREPNATGPGFDVAAELRMLVEPQKEAPELTKGELKKRLDATSPVSSMVEMDASRLGMRWYHDRAWHVTNEMPSSFIMRQIVDGDVLAQCHVSQLPQLAKGKRQSLEEFQQEVQGALGKRFARFELARQFEGPAQTQVLRVDAVGIVADVPIHWRYYNLQHPNGQRAAFVFTMKEDNLSAFGESDQQMLERFEFVPVAQVASKESR